MSLELSAEHIRVIRRKLGELGVVEEIANRVDPLVFSRYVRQGMNVDTEIIYEFHHRIQWRLRTGISLDGKRVVYCTDIYVPRTEDHAQSGKTGGEEK